MSVAESCMPSKLVRGSVMNSKKCSQCGETKSVDEYSPRPDRPLGYHSKCKECVKLYRNKPSVRKRKQKYMKRYHQTHKEERNARERKYRSESIEYKLRSNVTRNINYYINNNNGNKDGKSVFEYLPYTQTELRQHLESLFTEGMSWDNWTHDGWHIDHIYPQSKLPYDSMTHPNFQKAWALKNLQPLWAKENISKGNKI